MSQVVTVTGMVLSSLPIGEYDKRIVILTKERGKVSAFAKGSRRPTSSLAGVTIPCSFGTFTLYEGRTSYTVQAVEITHYFSELRTDLQAACYAFYFLEFADYYTKEGNDEREMLRLLYQTMRALVKRTIMLPLVRYIFELKAISVEGEGPQVFQCVVCGSQESPCLFSVKKGGLICDTCGWDVADKRPLDTSTLYAMQYIVSSPIEKLYTFAVSQKVLEELGNVVERYLDVYVGKRFRSLEILEEMESQEMENV